MQEKMTGIFPIFINYLTIVKIWAKYPIQSHPFVHSPMGSRSIAIGVLPRNPTCFLWFLPSFFTVYRGCRNKALYTFYFTYNMEMTMIMNIVDILKVLTDEGGLNIPAATLACYCDISPSAISAYLHGINTPTPRMIGKMRTGISQYVEELDALRDELYN